MAFPGPRRCPATGRRDPVPARPRPTTRRRCLRSPPWRQMPAPAGEAPRSRGRVARYRGCRARGQSRSRRRARATPPSARPATLSRRAAPSPVGPNLYGVVGRKIASVEGFNYTPAMKAHDEETIGLRACRQLWLTNPPAFAPGTMMAFPGLPDAKQRADVIAFLRTKADSPYPLPEAARRGGTAPAPEAPKAEEPRRAGSAKGRGAPRRAPRPRTGGSASACTGRAEGRRTGRGTGARGRVHACSCRGARGKPGARRRHIVAGDLDPAAAVLSRRRAAIA